MAYQVIRRQRLEIIRRIFAQIDFQVVAHGMQQFHEAHKSDRAGWPALRPSSFVTMSPRHHCSIRGFNTDSP